MPKASTRPARLPSSTARPPLEIQDGGAAADVAPSLSEQLQRLLAQYQPDGGYRVRVDRKNPSTRQLEYLGTVDLSYQLEDDTKAEWGGGEYRGRIVNPRGEYQESIRYAIAGPAKTAPVPALADPVVAPRESHTDTLLREVIASNRAIADALREQGRARTEDPVESFTKVATAFKSVFGNGGRSDTTDTIALVDRVLGLRDRILENGERPESELGKIVKDGVLPLVDLAREKIQSDKEIQMARLRTTSSNAPLDPVARLALRIPAIARAFLIQQAKADADPMLYAEVALDQLPGDVQDVLPLLVVQPDFTEKLITAIPAFAPYADWFSRFVDAMRANLSEDDTDSEPVGGAQGDAAVTSSAQG